MCYTIKIDLTREELEKRFNAKFAQPDNYKAASKVSAFSLPLLPVICNDNPNEITTRANTMMELIHNVKKRMPVILSIDNEHRWLDVNIKPETNGIFEPFPENQMYSEIVN